METLPITGLAELSAHLEELESDSSLPLDAKLFDEVNLQLTDTTIRPFIPVLLPKLTSILQSYTLDPVLLVELSIKLLGPVSFAQTLALADEDDLVAALRSPAPSANLLGLTILHKAAATPAAAALLATMPAIVAALLSTWLAAPSVSVGEKASRALVDLLATDCDLAPPAPPQANGHLSADAVVLHRRTPGQGRLWRLLFRHEAMYALLVALVSGAHPATASAASATQRSLAQGRLLRVLPPLAALNFGAVARSAYPDPAGAGGLLPYAALHMVDREDVLMHLSLVDFFEAFVSVMRLADGSFRGGVKSLLRSAVADDEVLRTALVSLPERTVPEEQEALAEWIREVLPGAEVRVGGWEGTSSHNLDVRESRGAV